MQPNPYEAPKHATSGPPKAITGRGVVMGCLLALTGLLTAFIALLFYLAYIAQVTV
jgi:hypothetical protein